MTRNNALCEKATIHTDWMALHYEAEIKYSIENSIIYGGSGKKVKSDHLISESTPEVNILNTDSTSAAIEYPGAILLNFASYMHPGGGFMSGAWAQEEAICHDSTLYNVLSQFNKSFYAENEKSLNKSLYTDRAIYSPKIIFESNGKLSKCDVITCAAPNIGVARGFGVTDNENEATLKQRIDFILSIAEENSCNTIILGAWGCGVFGQDPMTVANLFKNRLAVSTINQAIFAIPGQNNNYESFRKVFTV